MTARETLHSLAESRFAKEKADLVIGGTPDSSGAPVEDRLRDIREEHDYVEFRLVPVADLRDAWDTLDAQNRQLRELMDTLGQIVSTVPEEYLPDELRRAAQLRRQRQP